MRERLSRDIIRRRRSHEARRAAGGHGDNHEQLSNIPPVEVQPKTGSLKEVFTGGDESQGRTTTFNVREKPAPFIKSAVEWVGGLFSGEKKEVLQTTKEGVENKKWHQRPFLWTCERISDGFDSVTSTLWSSTEHVAKLIAVLTAIVAVPTLLLGVPIILLEESVVLKDVILLLINVSDPKVLALWAAPGILLARQLYLFTKWYKEKIGELWN